jgi:hypothetical protein
MLKSGVEAPAGYGRLDGLWSSRLYWVDRDGGRLVASEKLV